jgi:cell division protease FtsH
MDFKRILRGPLVYIVLGVLALWIGFSLLTGSGARQITTEEGLGLLSDNGVKTVKIYDSEQRVDLTLKSAYIDATGQNLGTTVQFNYVAARGADVVKAVDASSAKYDDVPPSTNWVLSLLSVLGPIRWSVCSPGSCYRACRAAATALCSSASRRRSSSRRRARR